RDQGVDAGAEGGEGVAEGPLGAVLEARVLVARSGVLGDVVGALEGDGEGLELRALPEGVERREARVEVPQRAEGPRGEAGVDEVAREALAVEDAQAPAEEVLELAQHRVLGTEQTGREEAVGGLEQGAQLEVDAGVGRD